LPTWRAGIGRRGRARRVELLKDIRKAFGEEDEIRSAELVVKLVADPERPWKEWRHGRDLTHKQLGGLLRPFCITSETINLGGGHYAKGYKRAHFEEAWDAYCPGQNTLADQKGDVEASFRHNADDSSTSGDFRSVTDTNGDASKNGKLSHSHAGYDASTDRKGGNGAKGHSDHGIDPLDDGIPDSLRRAPRPNPPALGPEGDSLDDLK
jgi:hypothetical protein